MLAGYDTSPQGELLVSTFTAGMHPKEPMSGHILPVIMSWHMGIELVRFTGALTGNLDPDNFWAVGAVVRGSEVATDVFADTWDLTDVFADTWHLAVAEEPLEEPCANYRVSPLDPSRAAHGTIPP